MNVQALINFQEKCSFPKRVTAIYLFYIVSLFLLFKAFFNKRWEGGDKKEKGAAVVEDKKRK
jgi:hypothetical protein